MSTGVDPITSAADPRRLMSALLRFMRRVRALTRQSASDPLRTTTAILRAQQEATIDGTLVIDQSGKVLSYNRRFLEIWGIPPGVAEQGIDSELLSYAASAVANWDEFIQLVEYLYHHPDEVRTDDIVELKDGRVLSRATVPLRVDDHIIGRAWYFRDVTGPKKAEKLQSALFRIANLSRESKDLGHFYADIHRLLGELMDVTNFYVAEYDEERDTLSFPYFVDQYDPLPPSDGRVPQRGLTAYVLRTGKPLLATPEKFAELIAAGEIELIGAPPVDWLGVPLKSGDRTWGVLGVQSYDFATRYTEAEKNILVFVSQHVAAAIQQRRAEDAEKAVEVSEEHYRNIVDFAPMGIYQSSPDGKILTANATLARILGYESVGDLLNTPLPEIYDDPTERDRLIAEFGVRGQAAGFDVEWKRNDGTRIWVRLTLHARQANDGTTYYEGFVFDITGGKEAEALLRKQSAAMSASMDGIAILSPSLNFTYVNDALANLYGMSSSRQLLDQPFTTMFDETERERLLSTAIPAVVGRGQWRGETVGQRLDGSAFPQEMSLTAIEGGGMVYIVRDVSERTYAEEQIRHLAYHDTLTGLPNRMLFKDRLAVALAQAQRAQCRVAVLFLDLDRFKAINDSLGHNVGDELLQAAAGRISHCVRESDTIARLGGDEFTLLLPSLARSDDGAPVALKILESLRNPFVIQDREFFTTASIGISVYPDDGSDPETLIKNADTAMYQAKELGRDNYQLFNAAINAKALQRVALEQGLRKALAHEELSLHYQPIIDVSSGRIVAAEALLRWNHPDQGNIPPSTFIPIAETIGSMLPIGIWALRTACAQARAWRDAGWRNLRLSMNLSVSQLQQPDIVEQVKEVLRETRMSAKCLELEITESMAISNPEATIRTLQELRALGVRIALDDFGTGHSSLSYIKRYPIDTLKIDQTFVHDIETDANTAAIVQAMIAMAHSLHLTVIAEGVETAGQASFLESHGCDQVQGFLLSRPLTVEAFSALPRP